ncbi:MAG: DNA mismatch repair protein MutS [Bdellovibrionaceae bacterium]|nr:DNA mismatch repair protein MutS [Pseudobdellovibrionaceae bacterium]
MRQYWSIKKDHLDKILLFRMGDFFEMFHQDAEEAAPLLNIALTQRNKKGGDDTKMCGVPHHSIAGPIAKLLALGKKVAICDQVEDPAQAKGIVRRAVTKILTPGMVYDPETLDQVQANYLAAYDDQVIAFFDSSTLEAFQFRFHSLSEREQLLQLLKPTELILNLDQKVEREKTGRGEFLFSIFEKSGQPQERLKFYLESLNQGELEYAWPEFIQRNFKQGLILSPKVISHLEIFENYRGDTAGSLFEAINRTKTSAGARLLKDWIRFPLSEEAEILKRQDQVARWIQDPSRLKSIRSLLGSMGDLERRLGRISSSVCGPRDFLSFSEIVDTGLKINALVFGERAEAQTPGFGLVALKDQIERTFVSEPPLNLKDGGFVDRGVYPELDELIDLSENAQSLISKLEQREKEALGVTSLKVRYNNVFGYYIELTKTHAEKAPGHYMRKQTLTNAERFTTEELNQLEEKVLSARTKRVQLEMEIFEGFRKKILDLSMEITHAARAWAEVDVLTALSWLAIERKYVRPRFVSEPVLNFELSRHPVLEQGMKGFVPNSVHMKNGDVILITGPNMAGKSTVMRQVALNVILAQMGSFVPCEKAEMPLFKKLFSRVGASDFLLEGLSTFMVEMTEAAEILNSFDEKSLILMDEIGRGTSTYDGMSLAQAIIEHFVESQKGFTLFSTHYHELTQLESLYPQVQNFHMSAKESQGKLQFQHTLKKGPANQSYGIQVARLAGVPSRVTERARQILQGLEAESFGESKSSVQMDLFQTAGRRSEETPKDVVKENHPMLSELQKMSLSEMTPLEVLMKVNEWQKSLS